MPTYEYACAACDTTHEVQQKMTDPSLTDCPSCGDANLRKLFTNVGVVFKGSGFYRTDSRSGSSSTVPAASSSSSNDSGSSSAAPAPAPAAPSPSTGGTSGSAA